MLTSDVRSELASHPQATNIYLYGIEAHVCVLQTTLDLLREGYAVYLVNDGVSSMRAHDRDTAIKRLEAAGAVSTTAESCLYELMGDAKHEKFKACLPLVKELSSFFKQETAAL